MTPKKQLSYDYIALLIRGAGNLGKKEMAEQFFLMLQKVGDKLIPTRIGIDEPMKVEYSLKNAKKLWVESEKDSKWGGGLLFKGSPGYFGSVEWNNADNSNDVSLRIPLKILISNGGIKKLIDFAKKVFIWSNGYYGHAYHGSKPIYSSGLGCDTCLPGISWMNLFGKPYVQMFGADVIESTPIYVEKFAENSYMLLTSGEPVRVTPEMIQKHELVKKHLGEDAFDRKDPPRHSVFTAEDIEAGLHLTSKEGYRSPDLSEYLKEPAVTNEKGLFVFANDDGTLTPLKVK